MEIVAAGPGNVAIDEGLPTRLYVIVSRAFTLENKAYIMAIEEGESTVDRIACSRLKILPVAVRVDAVSSSEVVDGV
jgi:hypothetical protein